MISFAHNVQKSCWILMLKSNDQIKPKKHAKEYNFVVCFICHVFCQYNNNNNNPTLRNTLGVSDHI